MALCLGRTLHRSLLAPCYIEAVDSLPTYMTMTQWIDLKKKKTDPDDIDKLLLGCEKLLKTIELAIHVESKFVQDLVGQSLQSTVKQYEVFLSYAHRDAKVSEIFTKVLRSTEGIKNVFYDRDEIKTGFSWLQTLYE